MKKQKNFSSQDAARLAFKEVQDEIEQVNFSSFGCGGCLFVVLSCLHVAKQRKKRQRGKVHPSLLLFLFPSASFMGSLLAPFLLRLSLRGQEEIIVL